MKHLNKIRLTAFAEKELGNRELGKVLGGENCCICSCSPTVQWGSVTGSNNESYAKNSDENVGYGVGAFAPSRTK